MGKGIREWLNTKGGRVIVIVLLVPVLAGAVYSLYSFKKTGGPPDFVNYRMCICTETGKTFRHRLEPGESLPYYSPYSGKNTGLPAEPCYWTKDGGTKSEPTWVLINEYLHKPGPTFCPDCGRLVIGHNPPPGPGVQPPPTQQEWMAAH